MKKPVKELYKRLCGDRDARQWLRRNWYPSETSHVRELRKLMK